jgi:putative transposase
MLTSGHNALRKGRYSQENQIYHVTFTTYLRQPEFIDFTAARTVCNAISAPGTLQGNELLAWTLMPDHIHLLFQLKAQEEISDFIRRIKSSSSLMVNRRLGRSGKLWAPGYYDHAIRNDENLLAVARYIVANPLRAGICSKVAQYPYWNAKWL